MCSLEWNNVRNHARKYYSSAARFKRTVLGDRMITRSGSVRVREKTFTACQYIYKVIKEKPIKSPEQKICLADSIQEPFESSLSASSLVLSVQTKLQKNNNGPGDEADV
jgi:hypothetical protein